MLLRHGRPQAVRALPGRPALAVPPPARAPAVSGEAPDERPLVCYAPAGEVGRRLGDLVTVLLLDPHVSSTVLRRFTELERAILGPGPGMVPARLLTPPEVPDAPQP